MIDLDKKSLDLVRAILKKHLVNTQVKAFGSRVSGSAKPYSDLDLIIMGNRPVSIEKLNEIKFEFSNSDLPILIDIVDWHAISDSFREKIKADCELL